MTTRDKIADAFEAVTTELTGAGGYFERQRDGMVFLLQALDASRAYVYGEGPKPTFRLESPVELASEPAQRDLSGYGETPPQQTQWPSTGQPGDNGDLPSILATMRHSGALTNGPRRNGR